MRSYNIRENKYCYIGPMFKRVCEQTEFEDLMKTDKKKWKTTKKPEMIFIPSSSDIFYENVEDYVCDKKKSLIVFFNQQNLQKKQSRKFVN